ncbi:MAG TPA: hypothetical protein VGA08_04075, partial [Candidatus Saccharimonadales bacterium]
MPIALIWLGAAIVYIVALFRIGDLSYDEAFSLHFASLPLGQMLELLRFDIHPPLYYVFLNGWTKLFGLTELAGRIPSVIFSLLSLPIFF